MTQDKIREILESLGYKLFDRGAYWQTNAIFRNGDNKTAIQIYKDSGVWKDHVSQTSFMPLKKLIELTLGTNDKNVIKKYISNEEPDFYISAESNKPAAKITMDKVYSEDSLSRLFPHFDFYTARGISEATLKFFKSGLATSGPMYQRFVFPIYNEHGQIHGFAGRDVSPPNKDRPKWKHVGKKTKWIYPYFLNEKFFENEITSKNQLIIVESIGDMLSLFENGFKNVLVSFGLDISPQLMCFLIRINPQKVILSFNNDEEKAENRGLNSCIKSYLKLLPYFNKNSIKICVPTKNDFGDMTQDDFSEWSSKLSNILKKDQLNDIFNMINTLEANKSLSSNILKNKKYLNV
tara:strand:+ start:21294 stop:22343 length:1050 start_codon:yes stop_codon:yes gene_type:complete